MKIRIRCFVRLAASVLIGCLSVPVEVPAEVPATDVATYEQIQEALDSFATQSEGKVLSVGSWVGDVFVLPYSSPDPYDCFVGGNLNVQPRQWVARSFLADNPDDYDFLLVFTRFEFGGEDGISGFYWEVKNDVQGIGIPLFDLSQEFGSSNLQGFVDGGSLSQFMLEDGSVDSNRVTVVLNHELAHRWSARCRFVDDGGETSMALLGADEAHWSYLLDSDASYLYGSDWTDNHDGTFIATDVLSGFSDLDLYLMGLADPTALSPFTLLEDPAVSPEGMPQLGDVVSATPTTVSIDQVIAAEGPRAPAFSQSPKEFRIAVIYLVEPDAQIGPSEIASIEEIRSQWRRSFFRQTGGQAIVDVGMTGSPPVSGADFDLQAARMWLESAVSGGLWQDTQKTIVRDTSESLTALARFASASSTIAVGVDVLGQIQTDSVELIARQVESLALNGALDVGELLAGGLVDNPGQGGAWGGFDRYSPDAVTSAVVLRALSATGIDPSLAAATWSWIVAQQNTDGGWGWRPDAPSAVYPTLEVLQALVQTQSAGNLGVVAPAATSWLLQQQHSDGGFGEPYSGILETALFLRAAGGLPIDQSSINDAVVFLAQRQEGNGSWEGRTLKTAACITALAPYFMPDPSVSADEIFAAPAVPFEDDELSLQGAVRNRGGLLPSGTQVRWELLDASQPNTVWASTSDFLPEIAGGSWVIVEDSWTPNVPAGSYLLSLSVDPDLEIDDGDPSNNRATIPFEIKAHPEGVDLSFANGSPIVSPDSVAGVPQAATVFGAVVNLGQTSASGTAIVVFDGDPAHGMLLASQVLSISGLSSVAFDIPVILPEPKAYSLTVVIDPDDILHDEDRSDNTAQLALGLTSTFDPGVVPGTFTAVPAEVITGDSVTLSATIRNGGTEEIGGIQVAFSYETGSPLTTHTITLQEISEPIAPGEARDIQVSWRPAVAGVPVNLSLEVDPHGLIQDVNLDNNAAVTTIVITPSDLPNLVVSPESLTFDPDQSFQGDSVALSGQITNNGISSAGPFTAQLRLDDPGSGPVVASSTFGGLDPGETTTLAGNWTVDAPEDRLVYLVIDLGNEVEEFNEQDNQAFRVLGVQSLPDLVLTSGSVQATPPFPHSGEAVVFSVTVENSGDQPADATTVDLLDEFWGLLGSAPLAAVPAHGQTSTDIDWQAPESAGEVVLHFRVNADQSDPEQSYDNNYAPVILAVQDADFFLSNPYCSPNGDGVQDSVTFYFRQEVDVLIVTGSLGEFIRTIAVAVGQHSAQWDGRDETGSVVPDGVYSVESGTLAASVVVDTNRIPLTDDLSGDFLRTTMRSTPDRSFDFDNMALSPADGAAFFNEFRPGFPPRLVRFAWGEVVDVGSLPIRPLEVSLDETLFSAIDRGSGPDVIDLVRYPGPIVDTRVLMNNSEVSLSPDGHWFLEMNWGCGDEVVLVLRSVDDPGVDYEIDPFEYFGGLEGLCVYFDGALWSSDSRNVFVKAGFSGDGPPYEHRYFLISPQEGAPPEINAVSPEGWPNPSDCDDGGPEADYVSRDPEAKGADLGWGEWISVDFANDRLFFLHDSPCVDFDGYKLSIFSLTAGERLWSTEEIDSDFDSLGLSNDGHAYLLAVSGDAGGVVGPVTLRNWQTGEQAELPAPTDAEATPIWSPLDKYIYLPGSDVLDVIGTAGNLTVDLKPHVLFGNAGISLSVVATDRNLDHFLVDFATAELPGSYFPLGSPSGEPMFGESWGTWLPPAKGRFLLRLSAADLAGNRRSVTKSVFWNGDNDIANLALDHRFISPVSSPGVKDALIFHYVVLRPANLVFEIKDDDESTVKTIPVA
ncbi:MAG: hypothetical protein DRJ65_15020, partial [Acidobacteria bacterium]